MPLENIIELMSIVYLKQLGLIWLCGMPHWSPWMRGFQYSSLDVHGIHTHTQQQQLTKNVGNPPVLTLGSQLGLTFGIWHPKEWIHGILMSMVFEKSSCSQVLVNLLSMDALHATKLCLILLWGCFEIDVCHCFNASSTRSRWLWSRLIPQSSYSPVKGLYLYGGVGTGKTMLMDLFFDRL